MELVMKPVISTETAKSILRVMLATAIAQTTLDVITESSLTMNEQTDIMANALMTYRSCADEGEQAVDAEVTLQWLRAVWASNTSEWATQDEARQHWLDTTIGLS
jgi:hypothetical protein